MPVYLVSLKANHIRPHSLEDDARISIVVFKTHFPLLHFFCI